MDKFTRFISGQEYSLKELFGNDTKIIIPDLQRDYCWGDNAFTAKSKKPQELVSGFLDNIIQLYKEDTKNPITLGLIYGYEQPYNNIQICDGQQRLTTLFLILGMVNIRCNGRYNDFIISERERLDDNEPHLQYAIRESTLYFISDLSIHVFINFDTRIDKIKESNWYFSEYEQDASIQSIIAALLSVNQILEKHSDIEYERFGNYLLNNLRVLYYDMENRSRGEETYIVINTTGEPLSATENIKPILLGNPTLSQEDCKKYSDQWEEREEWFWQNRGQDKTSDPGMQIFFTWYWQIGLMQEYRWEGDKKYPLNIRELFISQPSKVTDNANEIKLSLENYNKFKSLDNLNKYFHALKALVETIVSDERIQKVLLTINKKSNHKDLTRIQEVWSWLRTVDLHIVLPLICFRVKYDNSDLLYQFVRRIRKNHYDYIWSKDANNELSRRGKNYIDWRYIIQIIDLTGVENLFNVDISELTISRIPMIPLNTWYTEDERWKTEQSNDIQNIEEIEDNEVLMGDLTALRKGVEGFLYDIDGVNKRWNNLKKILDAFKSTSEQKDYELKNWFRLYCVVMKITTIGHINYCNWDMEGCYFSAKREQPWWIEFKKIDNLLNSNNLLNEIKTQVKSVVSLYIKTPQNHIELINSWLTLKTIKASQGKFLLNYYNDRAISAFIDLKKNYIIPYDDFHWGNILCGYSYSYTIYPARDKDNWKKPNNLDSPLSSIQFISNYNKRNSSVITNEDIVKYDKEIQSLIDQLLLF